MSDSESPAMDLPNLICPECDYQFQAIDVSGLDQTSFQTLVGSCSCRNCGANVHPEDALLEYFEKAPTTEIRGRPISIGGRASVGTIELTVGETRVEDLVGGGGLTIDRYLLAETDQPPDQSIRDLEGVDLEWFTNLIVDDAVIVDIAGIAHRDGVGFVTSELDSTTTDEITVAYNYQVRPSDIEQPSWVKLLLNAAQLYSKGEGLAMLPLLMAAFENQLARQLWRTLQAQGYAEAEIDDFLSEENYYRWKDRSKEGLEEVTSHRFSTYDGTPYTDFEGIHTRRSNQIIHVDPDEDTADITHEEMAEYFDTTVESILTIHEICYQERMSI
jgi:hypothetical protein